MQESISTVVGEGRELDRGGEGAQRVISGVLVAVLVTAAVLNLAACERPAAYSTPAAGQVTGMGAGVSWYRVPSRSARGRWIYWGALDGAAGNTGPFVLIIPGGGGQVSVDVDAQARSYADSGLRPVIGCIATISGMWAPSPATSCTSAPASTPGSLAAGEEVLQLVAALEAERPELVSHPARLVVVGDSYGGAAALQAAAIGGFEHPVVTISGANTWLGATKPLVPRGDIDPADPRLLKLLDAPVTQVVGLNDSLVPPKVATNFAHFAAAVEVAAPIVALRNADHIAPINADETSCLVHKVIEVITTTASGSPVQSQVAC